MRLALWQLIMTLLQSNKIRKNPSKQFLDVSITFPASKNVNPNITYYGVDEYLSFEIGNYILEMI